MINRFSCLVVVLLASISLSGCDVEQTQEGKLPKVEAEGGQLPKYDVQTGDVDVGTEEKTITVPDVDVTTPGEENQENTQPER